MTNEQKSPKTSTDLPEDIKADIRAAKAQYAKQWRQKNPEKQAAIIQRYWMKKLKQQQEQTNAKKR